MIACTFISKSIPVSSFESGKYVPSIKSCCCGCCCCCWLGTFVVTDVLSSKFFGRLSWFEYLSNCNKNWRRIQNKNWGNYICLGSFLPKKRIFLRNKMTTKDILRGCRGSKVYYLFSFSEWNVISIWQCIMATESLWTEAE